MDIARLPVAAPSRFAPLPARQTRTSEDLPVAGPVGGPVRRGAARPPVEQVVQGELLERRKSAYQTTRAFLDERTLDHTRPADAAKATVSGPARAAIASYLNHVRPESRGELAQGNSVDLFI